MPGCGGRGDCDDDDGYDAAGLRFERSLRRVEFPNRLPTYLLRAVRFRYEPGVMNAVLLNQAFGTPLAGPGQIYYAAHNDAVAMPSPWGSIPCKQ